MTGCFGDGRVSAENAAGTRKTLCTGAGYKTCRCKNQGALTQKVSEEKRYRHQKMRIYEDFGEGKLNREQYLQEKTGIAEHLEELSAQITVAKKTIEEMAVKGQVDHTEITDNQRFEEYRGQELSETMLSALIRKVIITPDGGVEIYWRYRDELLGENPAVAR